MRRIYPFFLFFCSIMKFLWFLGKHHFKRKLESVMSSKDFQRIQWLSSFRPLAKVNQLYDDVFHVFSNADSICYGYFPSGLPDTDLDYTWNGNAWDLAYRTLHTNTKWRTTIRINRTKFFWRSMGKREEGFFCLWRQSFSKWSHFILLWSSATGMDEFERSLFNYSLRIS